METEEDIIPEEPIEQDTRVDIDAVTMAVCEKCGCEIDVEGIDSFAEVECPDCSERVTVPAKLGPFLLTSMLGAGGMGAVYVAKDEALGRQVAIKVMLKELGEDAEFIAAFKREAQAAAKINHPNICQIYSFGTEKGQPYIVMELITGKPFDKLVEVTKNLDQGLVMQVGHDVAKGLAAANDEKMIHGDIKPENILLDEKFTAKVVDFGIASVAGQGSEGIWGTPYYIAPEKILRQKPDGRSDMYSLGATLYHALAGRPPFEGATPIDVVKKRLDQDPRPLSSIRKDLKPEVCRVIERMLQREPGKRHPTYASLVSDLAKCVQICGGRKKSLSKLKKSGRIVLTKRSQSATARSAAPKAAAPNSAPKIRVAKKTISVTSSSSSSSASRGSPSQSTLRAKATPKKPPSKAPLVLFLLLLVAATLGGGGYYLMDQRKKKLEVRRKFFAYQNALADIGTEMTTATNLVKSVYKTVKSTAEYGPMASNAVKVVLGEELVHPIPVVAAEPEPAPADKPVATNAPAIPAAAPKPPPKTQVTRDSSGRDAPAGIGRRDPPAAVKEEPKPPPAPAATTPVPVAVEAPEPPEDEPIIKKLARKVIDSCIVLHDQLTSARGALAKATTAYEEGRDSRDPIVAAEKLAAIKNIVLNLETLKKNVKTVATRVKKEYEALDGMREDFVKREAERVQAEADAEKARLARLEAERIEEEHLALVSVEQDLVTSAHSGALELYKLNSYADGVAILKAQANTLTTDEAKKSMSDHLEQGKLLVEMKIYLAKQLTANPYAWGWIQSGRAIDVVKADVKSITTRTGKYTWEEVTVKQMLHFFIKYIKDGALSQKILGRHNLAAAIYCHVNGGAKVAASYKATALEKDTKLGPLASRVLPPDDNPF
jgi:serine/threonine protein kinase